MIDKLRVTGEPTRMQVGDRSILVWPTNEGELTTSQLAKRVGMTPAQLRNKKLDSDWRRADFLTVRPKAKSGENKQAGKPKKNRTAPTMKHSKAMMLLVSFNAKMAGRGYIAPDIINPVFDTDFSAANRLSTPHLL